ncbi:PilZ domain-containing protein [Rhodothalassium salexigens DSM 2132]|uniref:PilZ domain-containing protein n=1 Tax=Rhodothalassium salexigens DSM 2132 TaxID=1188247 RepID=A0A4R2PIZ8_RHOSA|nr:PilZ domain-containing protein [Rhodothalassium salexigens]MBB4211376.1 hypothetical protein [Rhodothalassium salexigens DSM 2132]MBK1637709.1 hypothetical protein [Rhodothalassium salexigens DSM 2132]TCP35297.1 PilZ domain-containing protein [Rhodothalassium salexigens DSM 2132]
MSDGSERREDDRLDVVWRATLVVGDQTFQGRLVDVSTAGARIHFDAAPALTTGTEGLLKITELGEFAARVAWIRGIDVGLQMVAGPDLLLKKFAEASGEYPSQHPTQSDRDPLT